MGKRYFLVELNGYGGEFTMGTVNESFVEYWKTRDDDELIDHLSNLEWDEDNVDTDSPDLTADGNAYIWDIDDYEHQNSLFADGGYHVTEIELTGSTAYNSKYNCIEGEFEYNELDEYSQRIDSFDNCILGREVFTHGTDNEDGYVPVLVYIQEAKGNFGSLVIETEDDFDPALLGITVLETDFGELVDRVYYNGKEIEINYDYADSNHKGTQAFVGYLNPEYYEGTVSQDDIDEQLAEIFG